MKMKKFRWLGDIRSFAFGILVIGNQLYADTWVCHILPSEQKMIRDEKSGAELIFVTTDNASDNNLYFHDRCWLLDGNMMLFYSDRSGRNEIYGYLKSNGKLVRLDKPEGDRAHSAVASREADKIYVIRNQAVYLWKISLSEVPVLKVSVDEKKIGEFPPGSKQFSGLNENSNATLVSFGYIMDGKYYIAVAQRQTGLTRVVARPEMAFGHLQFSWDRPDLLSFSGSYGGDTAPLDPSEPAHARIWFVNTTIGIPFPAFFQKPGELATHECWWVHDQITFIGGHRPEEAHVKVLDLKTGGIHIIGAGAWWSGGSDKEVSEVNWWHAAGSPDGHWVAADNWHGIIALFNAKTTEMKTLTTGHRTYGGGAHPHVGWDLSGKSVEFTSNKNGNPDVCIAVIPENW
jgi:oligogalacturonide lyase